MKMLATCKSVNDIEYKKLINKKDMHNRVMNWRKTSIRYFCLYLLSVFCIPFKSVAQEVIHIPLQKRDATYAIRQAIEGSSSSQIKIILDKGTYFCRPDSAAQKYMTITNHGNGLKNLLFAFENRKSVEIAGNGATILCHGQLLPFLFENCGKVDVSSLTVNWDIPFTFLGEVVAVNQEEEWRDIKPMREGFSWKIQGNRILFPNIDGFNYDILGSTLAFDKETKQVYYGTRDIDSDPIRVEQLKNGDLRFYEKLSYYPPVGCLLSSKGDRHHDRYAPAFEFKESSHVTLTDITVHHALGMGFLFERTESIVLRNTKIVLPPNTHRVISTTADATHFANCKGDILIENCTFENMLDDGTNVHGIYVSVSKVLGPNKLRVSMNHFEQQGFKCVGIGDEVWFIQQPSPIRGVTNKVTDVKVLNEKYVDVTFKDPLPEGLQVGDLIENKTWNPTFTMRNCTIRNHRARNILLKTPYKILIEHNHFSSMMSAIQIRGESVFWFESGGVNDVVIRNNKFTNCVTCQVPHALLYISPRLGAQFDQTMVYNRNIQFVSNEIDGFSPRIIWAERVENLRIKHNSIHFNTQHFPVYPDTPIFDISLCKNVCIEQNKFSGKLPSNVLKVDKVSDKTLVIKHNKNIDFKKK